MKKNVLTTGKKLQANQAAAAGDRVAAQALYASVCKLDPMDVEAWTKLSLIEKALGNYSQAEHCARRALLLAPKLGYAHFALGQALHSQTQRKEAIASYCTAIRLIPDLVDAHYLLGLVWHEEGDLVASDACLRLALRLRPAFPEALAELGAVRLELGQLEDGISFLRRAAALRPLDAIILGNISHALRLQGNNQAALDSFRMALELAPSNVDLVAGLASMLEKQGQTSEAQSLVDRGLQLVPQHVMCNLVAAQLERRMQKLKQAADRLQSVLSPKLLVSEAADIALELGQIYDQMGDAERAFPLMVEGKRQKSLATLGHGDTGSTGAYFAKLARIRQLATPELGAALELHRASAPAAAFGELPSPVFLIGFPRSGTTLMEQILDSHPGIQAMEEKPPVAHVVDRVLSMLDSQSCDWPELGDRQLAELRALYFSEVAKYIHLEQGLMLIDKMPLNAVVVPVIARVFPDAKFILAIRHPCDVILSCLMQNFAINAAMANFLTLEDSVHLYAQVMGAWLHYAEVLPLNVHQIRYEDLIENVPGESRKLIDFLGLPWDDAVLKHTEHARQRGAINTPSYHQVVQPIYQRSKYRWVRYEHQLATVLPDLQPFIDFFGYDKQ